LHLTLLGTARAFMVNNVSYNTGASKFNLSTKLYDIQIVYDCIIKKPKFRKESWIGKWEKQKHERN
jgi:hypothetical protein